MQLLMLCLLATLAFPLHAEDNRYNLPSLYSDQKNDDVTVQEQDPMEKSLQGRKRLEQSLKQFTRTRVGDDSTVYLRRKGIELETQYRQGDVRTYLETKGDEEVTFTLKVSF